MRTRTGKQSTCSVGGRLKIDKMSDETFTWANKGRKQALRVKNTAKMENRFIQKLVNL